ncbi:MAG: hypothetical protein RIG84_19060 [Roseovarius sp.]
MTALPHLTSYHEAAAARGLTREPVAPREQGLSVVRRALFACSGTGLMAAAAGLWLVPAPDAAVMLVKLGASIAMAGAGAMLLGLLKEDGGNWQVELDAAKGEVRTFEKCGGQYFLTGRFNLRDMAEVTLHGATLTAHDAEGRVAVAVPVTRRADRKRLRALLELG